VFAPNGPNYRTTPAVNPVVTATGDGGRNPRAIYEAEFDPTIPAAVPADIGRQLRNRADGARRLPGGAPWAADLRAKADAEAPQAAGRPVTTGITEVRHRADD